MIMNKTSDTVSAGDKKNKTSTMSEQEMAAVLTSENIEAVHNKLNVLMRMDFGYAEQILMKRALGLTVSVVTPAHIAWVAYRLHVTREYLLNLKPVLSVEELEDNEQDWDLEAVKKEFPIVGEWEAEIVVVAALHYRSKKVVFRREELESCRKSLMKVCKEIAIEILEENNMLNTPESNDTAATE